MPPRRRVDPDTGRAALAAWLACVPAPAPDGVTPDGVTPDGVTPDGAAARQPAADRPALPRQTLAAAVRWTLEELAARVPGHATEVRVPPFAAVQCLPGPGHTRGTPPNVVETDPATWLALVTGRTTWARALASGTLRASGERADLSGLLPLRHLGP